MPVPLKWTGIFFALTNTYQKIAMPTARTPFVIPNADEALAIALREGGLLKRAELAFAAHPEIQAICLNLAIYLLRMVPAHKKNTPLLDVCIETGFAAMSNEPATHPVASFSKGALRHIPDVMNWAIFVNRRFDGAVCWDYVREPISSWLLETLRLPNIVYRSDLQQPLLDPAALREVLAFKLIPSSVLTQYADEMHQIIEFERQGQSNHAEI